jgi:uncharacterized RDD family membrane protein YckC
MNSGNTKLYYASWWRRFGAFMIDYILFLPLGVLQYKTWQTSPQLAAILVTPVCVIPLAYFVIGHGVWGRTIGKLVVGTRVVALDGSRITWRQSFLRSAVDILLLVPVCYVYVRGYASLPSGDYTHLSPRDKYQLLNSLWPQWYHALHKVHMGWTLSEFIVILLNKQRRALHDYIAGTVVVQKVPSRAQARAEDPYNIDVDKEMKRMNRMKF